MTMVRALLLEKQHELALRDIDLPMETFGFEESIKAFGRAVEARPTDVRLQIRME